MDGMDRTTPLEWVQASLRTIAWPALVIAAFWLGRYVSSLETRVHKAEVELRTLVERHMPAIHRALAEIRGLLIGGR